MGWEALAPACYVVDALGYRGPVRRRKKEPPQDNSCYARGWVEGVLPGDVIEGLFSSDGVFDQFGGLKLNANGEIGICPWNEVQSVTMKLRTELPEPMVRSHYDNVFARSSDPYVFMGWLPDGQGRLGQNPFVMAPVGDRTWSDWQQLFRQAGCFDEVESTE